MTNQAFEIRWFSVNVIPSDGRFILLTDGSTVVTGSYNDPWFETLESGDGYCFGVIAWAEMPPMPKMSAEVEVDPWEDIFTMPKMSAEVEVDPWEADAQREIEWYD